MVGSIMAAMQHANEPFSRVDDIMRTIDYMAFLDRRKGARFLKWSPRAADAWGVLFHLGAHPGRQLDQWLRGVLADLGVRTFGDLYFDDPGSVAAEGPVVPARRHRQRPVAAARDVPAVGPAPRTAATPTSTPSRAPCGPRQPSRSCSSRCG